MGVQISLQVHNRNIFHISLFYFKSAHFFFSLSQNLQSPFYPKHYCGVFGVYGHPNAAELTYYGLYALQHRGQESAGIVTCDDGEPKTHKGMGLVADVFDNNTLKALSGNSAVGHVRYSTTGSSLLKNAQPFVVDYAKGDMAIAHNGNLNNASLIKSELESKGSIFQSNMDTEVIVHLIARSKEKPPWKGRFMPSNRWRGNGTYISIKSCSSTKCCRCISALCGT
jgi:amidophosphoribosyltransferase